MSKEEFLKIQTCTLKVSIHCDGCKRKVKKTLQKLDGVYTVGIDSEQGKVTVSGNFDPATLLKKLAKSGKNAEIWGAPKPNQQMNNQLKNMQIDSGKGNQGQKGGGNNQQQPGKGAQPQQIQQLKQLQQLKGFQDLKLPGGGGGKDAQKSVKFKLPESDDDYDDDDDEFDDDDDDYDDDDDESDDDIPMKKPVMLGGGGGGGGGNMMMLKGGQMPNTGGKKGSFPVQVNGGGMKGGGAPGVGRNNNNVNGEKKGGMNDGLHGMPIPNMMGMGPTGQGLPAGINGGGAAGNPHYQQQLAAAMMNQQRSNGNERFQPMMYARPPPEVNYMQPPYPPYAYLQPPQGDLHGHYFNDDNTSSCSIM